MVMTKKWVIISCGDPYGVGYEIILLLLKNKIFKDNFYPLLVADKVYLSKWLKKTKACYNITYISKEILCQTKDFVLPQNNFLCIPIKDQFRKTRLPITAIRGEISLSTIDLAVEIVSELLSLQQKVGLVTMPVSKIAIAQNCLKKFSGHTEYIAEKLGINPSNVSMLMIGKDKKLPVEYKVLLLTRHIPLCKVKNALVAENIARQILNVSEFLQKYELKSSEIEILICGVNPHNGENGSIGSEEKSVLKSSVQILKLWLKKSNLKIKNIVCPILAEQAFKFAQDKNNVLIVCTYHDQGMLPLKLLCGHNIVNITVGLPFLRVSPGHGTAEDIVGENKVDITPTLYAIEKLKNYL